MYEDYQLYHHGIKGQKWGQRNGPPYPLKSSISTGKRLKKSSNQILERGAAPEDPARRSRLAKAKDIVVNKTATKITEMQEKREEKKQAKQAQKIVDEQQKKFEDKLELIRSGDQDEIFKRRNELTTEEFAEAIRRCQLNNQLMDTKPAKKTFTEKVAANAQKLNTLADVGVTTWNNFAKIYNTLNDKPIPVINGESFSLQRLAVNKKFEDHKVDEDKRRADSEKHKRDYEKANFDRATNERNRQQWEKKVQNEDHQQTMADFRKYQEQQDARAHAEKEARQASERARQQREAYEKANAERARREAEREAEYYRMRREEEERNRPKALPGPKKTRDRDHYSRWW